MDKQRWNFLGRMTSESWFGGVECYVWRWHPIDGVHPEADSYVHMVHWQPVAAFWPAA